MDEEEFDPKSEIGRLIQHLQKLCKKPQIDDQLSSALQVFQEKVTKQKAYLSNGIFNINFAEAALFLQSCSELYGKKIDLLWDQLLEFHTRLIEYDCQHEQEKGKKVNREVIDQLEERRNRYKRKKKFKLIVGQNDTNLLEDFLFEKPSAINEIEPYELDEDCFKSWRVVEHESSLITKIPKAVYKQQLLKYRMKNYRILRSEDFDIYDPDDGEFNTKYSRIPGWHVIEHIFEYNTKGLLPDKNNAIATLRLSCYLRAQFMRDNNIPFNAPYSQYKDQYLVFKKKFFEEEAKKWQNMPLNTMSDLRKQFEYLAKLERENEEKKETYKPWLEVFPSILKTGCNILNCPDCLDSKSSTITISDSLETDVDVLKKDLTVNLEKLPDDVVEKLRQDSGYFELEDFDKDLSTSELDNSIIEKTGENREVNDEMNKSNEESDISKDTSGEIVENEVLKEGENETNSVASNENEQQINKSNEESEISKEAVEKEVLKEGGNETNAVASNEIEQQINYSSTDITETAVMSEVRNKDGGSLEANITVSLNDESTINVNPDDDDVRSVMSDHDYCTSPDQMNILKENKNVTNKTKKEEMLPLKLSSKIIPRLTKSRVAKENRYKVELMGPPPPKKRKLSQKQVEKLMQSKIIPVNEMKFEKFFSLNYQPQMGEGEIQEVNYESEEETNQEVSEESTPEVDSRNVDHENDDVRSIMSDHSYCQPPEETAAVEADSSLVHDNDDLRSTISDHSYCQLPQVTEAIAEDNNEDDSAINDSGFIDNSLLTPNLEGPEENSRDPVVSSRSILRGLEQEDMEEYERLLNKVREERRRECEEMNILPEDAAKDREKRDRERLESKARVEEWRETITPILRNLKEKEFDIHEYGGKIMDSMEVGEKKLFKNIVNGKSSAEVVRYFIASLQLANTYNIEICGAKSGEMSNDTYGVKLLNTDRYHEHLTNYHAPSEDTFRERMKKMRNSGKSEQTEDSREMEEPTLKRARVDKTNRKRRRMEVHSSDEDDNYDPSTPVTSSQNRCYIVKRLRSSSNTVQNVDDSTPSTSGTCALPSTIENFESELVAAQLTNPYIQMFSTPASSSLQVIRTEGSVALNQRVLFK